MVKNYFQVQRHFYTDVGNQLDTNLVSHFVELLNIIRTEKITIVSYGLSFTKNPSFGSFIQRKISNFNSFSKIPVFPDAALLHFILTMLTSSSTQAHPQTVPIVTWASAFVDISQNRNRFEVFFFATNKTDILPLGSEAFNFESVHKINKCSYGRF